MKMSHDDLAYTLIATPEYMQDHEDDEWYVHDRSQLSQWGIDATYEAYRQTYVFLCRRVQR